MGEKPSVAPKAEPTLSVTAARGPFHQWGCECSHICPSVCSQAPCGIWGSCCVAVSLQRLQGLDVGGCRGVSSPLISAACSTTVAVSCGSVGAELCHWTLSEEVCTEGIQGKRAGISWRKDPVDTILQRLLPSLLYVCPIQCLFVLLYY